MPNAVSGLSVRRVSFVKRGAVRDPENPSQSHRRLLWKSDNTAGASAPSTAPKGASMTTEETQAALAKAEADRDEAIAKAEAAEAELEKARKKAGETGELDADGEPKKDRNAAGEFTKSELPEAARVAFEKQEVEMADLKKSAQEATDLAKAEQDRRVTAEFITKAEDFKALPITAADFGPVLKEASEKLSKESYEAIEKALTAADEQISRGELFKAQGRDGSVAKAGSAYAEAQQKAEELRKSDTTLTKEQALVRVFKADSDLQARYAGEIG